MRSRAPALRWVGSPPHPAEPIEWLITHEAGGVPFLSVGRSGQYYLVRAPGLADYWLSPSGAEALGVLLDASAIAQAEETFEQLVVPGIDHLQGAPAVHASAVATPHGGVAFLGPSGAGKSSLAGLLSNRWPLVADDYLPLQVTAEGVLALPSSSWVRLREPIADHIAGARHVRAGKLAIERPSVEGTTPLARIYVLGTSDDVSIMPCSRRDAILILASQLHRLDTAAPKLLEAELGFIEGVAARVRVCHLRYPRALEVASKVEAAILDDLTRAPESP